MGEVYQARDTRLERTVAVKVLAGEFSSDVSRRRFEREAKAIAALTHPSICTIYDVGDHEGIAFLVMELLDGETLAARLARGPLPIADVLAFATQIADGLDGAHRLGIVHRDLKPANVMLTRTGASRERSTQAKLLDFGLATFAVAGVSSVDVITATGPLTVRGELLGTLPYMAPEQLEGKPVDARTDVFAFGAMLHEMVTGQRAFAAKSQASLIGGILHSAPLPIRSLVPDAPPALERLIGICLSKDPADRWSTAHDVFLQLKQLSAEVTAGPTGAATPVAASPWRGRLAWGAAVVAALAVGAVGTMLLSNNAASEAPVGGLDLVSIVPPVDTTFVRGEAPQISPDGRNVAFTATDLAGVRRLYLRGRDSAAPRFLAGTENAAQPFWSPDSRMLGFFAEGQLKTVAIAGGSPSVIARAPLPRGGAWSPENLILFAPRPNASLVYVPSTGGEPTPVPSAITTGIPGFPFFLPDGRHYFYTKLDDDTRLAESLFLGSLDSPDTRRVVATTSSGAYASGHLLFRRNTTLLAQPFDLAALQLAGTPTAIAENVGYNPVTFQASFSASSNGAIVYRDALPGAELVWFDRQGVRLSQAAPPAEYNSLCLSTDGRRIVYDMASAATGNIDIWTMDLTSSASSQLTFAGPVEFYPVCSPDGKEVIFSALKPSVPNLFRLGVLSPGQGTALLTSPFAKIATDWARDGTQVLFSVLNPATNWDIASVALQGGEPRLLVSTVAEERNGKLSPNGRWLAYVSNETGRFEVYVQPASSTGTKWLVSKGGGLQPQWGADGRDLYYIAPNRKLMSVAVREESGVLIASAPTALMDTNITEWEVTAQGGAYAIAADGNRVLISTATGADRPITLLLNWTAALAP